MKSEKETSKWYDITGEKCLNFYKKSQYNELVQIKKHLLNKVPKKAVILDTGCGTGQVAKFLSNKGFQMTGIDISKRMINVAKKTAPKAKFKLMGLYDLEFPSETFDAITSLFVLLHLEKKKLISVFRSFNSILREKGLILFSINEGKDEGYYEFYGKKIYFSSYSKKEIKEILRKSRFKILWQKDFSFRTPDKKTEHQMYFLVQKS